MNKYMDVQEFLDNLENIKVNNFYRKRDKKILNKVIEICNRISFDFKNEKAYWIAGQNGYKCSSCNCMSSLQDNNLKSTYCPWCGKEMEGVKPMDEE